MEKLKMQSTNIAQDKIALIRSLFPGCVTEAKSSDGTMRLAVDFDQLRQELAESIVEGPQERYQLSWPGKRDALFNANAPIAKTLRPNRTESVNFDTTKNIFVEGDNLDALKLLQETYLGKIKLIYIDPPYNTGNDFIYEDDFSETVESYISKSLQVDTEGNRLIANTESNGRFHSDWLTMIYPRIKLSKNLLTDDGSMFISIDDNEVHNLRKICDEIFGEGNLIAQICHKARASISNDKIISANHNHILWYAKSHDALFARRGEIGLDPDLTGFNNPDNDPRGPWKSAPVDGPGGAKKGNPFYEFLGVEGYFRYSKETMARKHADGLIIKTAKGLQQKYYLSQAEKSRKTDNTWWDDAGLTSSATRALQQLMGAKTFDTPKPVELIRRTLELVTFGNDNDALVLDFFAGSATTAEAVMQANAKDGGTRRFILVQLSEPCDEKSDAYKAGYKAIPEISKERIRRAGAAVKGMAPGNSGLDIGFRVLKIDTSNIADVFYSPDEQDKGQLDLLVDNIKPDRTPEDLLFQVMLDWGVDLALPIAKQAIQGKDVFLVDGNALAACFDARGGIDEEFVKDLAKVQPLRAVFRDAGFKDSSVKINVEQIFKLLSPATEVKCI
jgi:adenine-specific DNA-methyltransferase